MPQEKPPNVSVCAFHSIFMSSMMCDWAFVGCPLSFCLSCFSPSFTSSLPHSTCTLPGTPFQCRHSRGLKPLRLHTMRNIASLRFSILSHEAGLSSTRVKGTTSTDITAVAMLVSEVWLLRIVKHSATSESWRAKFGLKLGPLGSSWARASGTNSAGATAVAKSVGEARPIEFMMYPNSQSLPTKLGLSNPERHEQWPLSELEILVVKIGLLGSKVQRHVRIRTRRVFWWWRGNWISLAQSDGHDQSFSSFQHLESLFSYLPGWSS